jgi:hypothetical protein
MLEFDLDELAVIKPTPCRQVKAAGIGEVMQSPPVAFHT